MLVVVYAALLGALVGVLVPRPAYRLSVPVDEPPRPACGVCDTPFPAGRPGWVPGRPRCPGCRSRLGPPAWLTGAAGALSFGALTWALWPRPVLAAALLVAALSLPLAAIDIAVLRLPDPLVGIAFAGTVLALLAASVVTGDYAALLRAAIGGAALFAVYLVLALVPGSGMGFGDVKLVGVLGLLLGWLGWGYVVAGALLPHLINAPVIVVLLLTGRLKRKSSLPLGPALLAGALLAIVLIAGWRRYLVH